MEQKTVARCDKCLLETKKENRNVLSNLRFVKLHFCQYRF